MIKSVKLILSVTYIGRQSLLLKEQFGYSIKLNIYVNVITKQKMLLVCLKVELQKSFSIHTLWISRLEV